MQDASAAWKTITQSVNKKMLEFSTVPVSKKRKPKWFAVEAEHDIVYVYAIIRDLSNADKELSIIKHRRRLIFSEFEKMFSLYFRRKNREHVSKEASEITYNQVYYYSLIKHLIDDGESS